MVFVCLYSDSNSNYNVNNIIDCIILNKKDTMEKMHISFIKDLRNIEFLALVQLLVMVLDSNKIDNINLKEATDRIKKQKKGLLLLRNTKLRHPLTRVINQKVNTRTEYLKCLRMKVDADIFSPKPEKRIAAERLKLWLRGYKKSLYAQSIHSQGQMVGFMKHERAEKSDIQNAVTLLDLDELLKDIEDITSEIDKFFKKRVQDKNYKSVKGQEIRGAAYEDLQLLIDTMAVSYRRSVSEMEKEQLTNLSEEINDQLIKMHAKLKSRNTRNNNKKEVVEAVKVLIDDSSATSRPMNETLTDTSVTNTPPV